jgi:phosphomannomutase
MDRVVAGVVVAIGADSRSCSAEDPSAAADSGATGGWDHVVEGIAPTPMMSRLVTSCC